ncbi:MAG TPA: 23S rRNA (pseudouridine(1915)-N(3))-methyltransferase RlmH [Bacteroidia bacterium]|nr:23S rRNA (pseudouridine(1915)-N(3))-methyltransferase RlmH [Bacteroidia bacterium]
MKITLIQIGKTSQNYLIEGINEYLGRLKHYCNFEILTILPPKQILSSQHVELIKKTEGSIVLSKLMPGDYVVLLDDKGKELDSPSFAEYINNHQIKSTKNLVFVIGGAFGFSEDLYAKANLKLSLSKLTFSHQMVRLFFIEQLYRAFTIIKGESYHHQ